LDLLKDIGKKINDWWHGVEEAEYYCRYFPHLSFAQIRHTLEVINEEVKRSRKEYKFVIEKEDLPKEKLVILKALDSGGGIIAIRKNYSREEEELFREFAEVVNFHLEDKKRKYFSKQFSSETEGSKLAYDCHLESVINRLLNDLFNDRIPFK